MLISHLLRRHVPILTFTCKQTISKDAEAAKVTTRMVRRKALEDVKSLKEYVSKDQVKRMEKSVQALTDGFVEKIVKLQVSKVRALDAGRSS